MLLLIHGLYCVSLTLWKKRQRRKIFFFPTTRPEIWTLMVLVTSKLDAHVLKQLNLKWRTWFFRFTVTKARELAKLEGKLYLRWLIMLDASFEDIWIYIYIYFITELLNSSNLTLLWATNETMYQSIQVRTEYRCVFMFDEWRRLFSMHTGRTGKIVWCMEVVMWVRAYGRLGVRGYRWDTMNGYAHKGKIFFLVLSIFLNSMKSWSTFPRTNSDNLQWWWARLNSLYNVSIPTQTKDMFSLSAQA